MFVGYKLQASKLFENLEQSEHNKLILKSPDRVHDDRIVL